MEKKAHGGSPALGMVADIAPDNLLVDAMWFFDISSSLVFAATPTIGLAIYNDLGPKQRIQDRMIRRSHYAHA